jgi:hypothetical protein
MPLTTLAPAPFFREFTNAGVPLVGGKLYTAQPGTTAGPDQSYPKNTYTDSGSAILNDNPVVLDSAGRAGVWLLGVYSMALYDANDVLIWSNDNVYSNVSSGGAGAAASTAFVFGDATSAAYNANILSANDPSAPDVYEISKLDASANPVTIAPATGTVLGAASFDLTSQGEHIRLVKYAATNDWMRG